MENLWPKNSNIPDPTRAAVLTDAKEQRFSSMLVSGKTQTQTACALFEVKEDVPSIRSKKQCITIAEEGWGLNRPAAAFSERVCNSITKQLRTRTLSYMVAEPICSRSSKIKLGDLERQTSAVPTPICEISSCPTRSFRRIQLQSIRFSFKTWVPS